MPKLNFYLDDGSDEQVEKIWLEYFDILNNGELKDVLSFMKPSVIFTFNNQTIKTEDHDQLFLLLKQWKENQKKKDIYIKNHSISSGKVADDFITIVDVQKEMCVCVCVSQIRAELGWIGQG